ncbi:hypothetical protein JVU11DRAFT_643 [Chiua virens]|nr:hypothetical protein JVU11DRAFT_643 [Chiua virens]
MLQAHHEHTPRISQLLPSVKCSNCGQSVPLADLGDHVCPPLPLPLQKTPKSTVALLPHRLQSLVARSATPPRTPPPEKPSEDGERVLAPRRDPFQPDKAKATPASSNFTSISLDRDPTRLSSARTPPPERVSTLSRDTVPIRPPILSYAHPDSIVRPPSRPAALSPARRDITPPPPSANQSLAPPRSPFPNHPSPSVTPSPNVHPHLSFDRTPSPASTSRPSTDKHRPSLDTRRPSVDSQQRTLVEQGSPAPPGVPFSRPPKTPSPAPVPPPPSPHPMPARQPPPPPLSLPYSHFRDAEIDTKTGGEAGMAGVGRRGFAAAARAAMLTASRSPSHPHRSNTPQYLNAQAILGSVLRGRSFI